MTSTHSPGDPVTLKALAARALTGDEVAFEELHQRLGGGLKSFIGRRLHSADEGVLEELAQEAWVIAWQALDEGRYDPERAAFSTFLYAVGHKITLRYLRDRQRQERQRDQLRTAPPSGTTEEHDPAGALDLAENLERLGQALRGQPLTDEERALARAVASGETERALAASLGLPPSTVHIRKKRLLSKLRALLKNPADSGEHDRRRDE